MGHYDEVTAADKERILIETANDLDAVTRTLAVYRKAEYLSNFCKDREHELMGRFYFLQEKLETLKNETE